jgi:hypothetical protein
MIEPAQTMLYKAILHILPAKSVRGKNFANLVLSILHDAIAKETGLNPDIEAFRAEIDAETMDGMHRLRVTSVLPPEHASFPFVWAMRLKSRDPILRHRIMTTHIGIHQTSDFEITLYFASMSADNLGGRMAAARPVVRRVSPLVEMLLTHPDLHCVTGNHVLLNKSIKLTYQSMEFFLDLLYDKTRTLPVILITCPDIVDPDSLHAHLQGNAVICYVEEPVVLMELNDHLPDALAANIDTIQIYLPLGENPLQQNLFHPTIPLSEIYRIGARGVYAVLYQAYSEYLRVSERKEFITIDTCQRIRENRELADLRTRLAVLQSNQVSNEDALTKAQEACRSLQAELDALRKTPGNQDISDYENLLSEYISETDQLKSGLQVLLSQLYNPAEPVHLEKTAPPLLHDFCEALQYRLRAIDK